LLHHAALHRFFYVIGALHNNTLILPRSGTHQKGEGVDKVEKE
jgi:hypothetical protein